MKRSIFPILLVLSLFVVGTAVAGGDVPDLKGTWVGSDLQGMKIGKDDPKHHEPDSKSDGVHTIEFTLNIESQKGRLLKGTHSSKTNKERVLGVISSDNKSFYLVDEDSHFVGKLLAPDKFELIWMEVHPSTQGVSHAIYTKKK